MVRFSNGHLYNIKGNNNSGMKQNGEEMFKENIENPDVINLGSEDFEKGLKEDEKAELVDVRTQSEYKMGHIPNSKLIDIMNPQFIQSLDELDRDKSYYVYCRSGNRSFHAGKQMIKMGFKKVYNLAPGIIGWKGEVEQ